MSAIPEGRGIYATGGGSSDAALPAYEVATSRDPIPLVSGYVQAENLFVCCLVSHSWRAAFEDRIWGEPADCWALGERSHLAGFLKFLSVLPMTAGQTRSLVHTLSLEQVHPTVYTRLPPTWLAQLLALLPNLQNLACPGFSFFDHSSLINLGVPRKTIFGTGPASYNNIKYLNISHLTNTTAASLALLLRDVTPEVTFLDLSYTNGANHPDTILAIGQKLMALKTLRFRGLKLTDEGLELLCRSVSVRLRRLDVSCNLLTDAAVGVLLDWSFMPPEYELGYCEGGIGYDNDGDNDLGEYLLSMEEREDPEDPCFGFSEGWTTAAIANRRRVAGSNQLPPPDIEGRQPPPKESGIISLSIADNRISGAGVISLLKSERLRSLDCGAIMRIKGNEDAEPSRILGVVPALQQYAFGKLKNLRVDYRIVCGTPRYNPPKPISTIQEVSEKDGSSSSILNNPPLTPLSPYFQLLSPSSLPKLDHLALVNVPFMTADESIVGNLLGFLSSIPPVPPHEMVSRNMISPKCVTLEFSVSGASGEEEDLGMYSAGVDDDTSAFHDASANDFSFFDESSQADPKEMRGDADGGSGKWHVDSRVAGSPAANLGEINVAEKVREWRKNGGNGCQWSGIIRLVRDFGGKERSVDGERWGLIVEVI